jgi:outer membrane protein assembly factor BamB
VRQYVQLTAESVVGISAKDGSVLWKAARKGNVAVIPTPIVAGNLVYVTSGYNAGSHLFKVTADAGKFSVEQVYANRAMGNQHGGVVKVGDCLYGYSDSRGLACQNFQTGEIVWAEKEKIKKCCVSFADGLLYCREEDNGTMVLLAASPAGYQEKGRFLQPDRAKEKAWPHPTIANGKLYLRDQDLLLCYDVK